MEMKRRHNGSEERHLVDEDCDNSSYGGVSNKQSEENGSIITGLEDNEKATTPVRCSEEEPEDVEEGEGSVFCTKGGTLLVESEILYTCGRYKVGNVFVEIFVVSNRHVIINI